MHYAIDILDAAKTRVAVLTGLTAARLSERVNAPAMVGIETVDAAFGSLLEPGRSFLRVRELPEGTSATFRVQSVRTERKRERPTLAVTARHLLGDAAEELFAEAADCAGYTPAELAERVLAWSGFGCGTVEPGDPVPFVRFEYEPVLDCLLRICRLTGGELALDEEAGTISILRRVGADRGVMFRYGCNLREAARTLDVARLANRVYGVGGGFPLLDLRGASGNGGLPFVEDPESIARWGLREAVHHEPTLEDVTNLADSPILDGEYENGLCAGWSNRGATVSRNADPGFRLYGRSSQRVRTTTAEQGIARTVALTPGKVHSLLAHVVLAGGTVRVRVIDGSAEYRRPEPVTGAGLAVVRIEGWKALSAAVTIEIVQEGSAPADFSVDSIQIAEGARVKPFTVGRSADTLRERCLERLRARKDPEITYDIDLVDRSGDPGMERTPLRFGLGDTVAVIDPTLDLRVSTRVMEREADLLRPSRVRVRLDTPGRGLAEILDALREAQADGVKHARAALAESSTAAEAGSRRLGFSTQTVRYTGTVAPLGWNGVIWSAGTLRAGDAWFALGAGSSTGMAANATFYYCFDRTAPAGFIRTASLAEAEGEDRVPVFAVTTTVSPSPCVVHSPGVIRG